MFVLQSAFLSVDFSGSHEGQYSRVNLAQLRVKKDIQELSTQRLAAPHAITAIEFPLGSKNVLDIRVHVRVTGGVYIGGSFSFRLDIPSTYPFHG
jgi:ubiquitin-conjugating enzyme E2 M